MEKEESTEQNTVSSSVFHVPEDMSDSPTEQQGKDVPIEEHTDRNPDSDELLENASDIQIDGKKEEKEESTEQITVSSSVFHVPEDMSDSLAEHQEKNVPIEEHTDCNPDSDELLENASDIQIDGKKEEKEESTEQNTVTSSNFHVPEDMSDSPTEQQGKDVPIEEHTYRNSDSDELLENASDIQIDGKREEDGLSEKHNVALSAEVDTSNLPEEKNDKESVSDENNSKLSDNNEMQKDEVKSLDGFGSPNSSAEVPGGGSETCLKSLNEEKSEVTEAQDGGTGERTKKLREILYADGVEVSDLESTSSSDNEPETQGYAWPEKAMAVSNFVKAKSAIAVSNVLRRFSGRSTDECNDPDAEDDNRNSEDIAPSSHEGAASAINVGYGWNPFRLLGVLREGYAENKAEEQYLDELVEPIAVKGRVILYTRLGCQDCKEARLFLHKKRLRYVEINIDIYPGRKLELERISGSSAIPRVLFNEVLIGGLDELRSLDESGKLADKIEYVVNEAPSFKAPLPPLSGEDDLSSSGALDELALVVRKMKDHIVVRDRFFKMRRCVNCFVGSEAVDFLSEDQYLEREEAIEFGRKLAKQLFFHHVLDENVFEDGNHLYRFLDHDPLISQCQNIPRGIIEIKPKPIIEISSRLRYVFYAILEAYTSGDGKHVDYRSIHGSEEFARYLRIVEELQRVELQDMPREEKLAFFINLFNIMTIHAILVWGHPSGPLERRKLFGDFKYVIGGCTFTLSAIYNGVLRANQRPPYNFIRPFGAGDKRLKVALPQPEPLVHFALADGTRSGPGLRCYSPGNVDKELTEAASNFLKTSGLLVDLDAKTVYVSKILKWYSTDFGTNEAEMLKHVANYMEPEESKAFLEMLSKSQLKVMYQFYDWRLNN